MKKLIEHIITLLHYDRDNQKIDHTLIRQVVDVYIYNIMIILNSYLKIMIQILRMIVITLHSSLKLLQILVNIIREYLYQ